VVGRLVPVARREPSGGVRRGRDGRDGATVVGYAVAWFAADEAELANLAVAASARGRGVGALLLDAVLAEAAHRGAATVYLEVRESNAAARRLYASRSFAEVGRRRRYYHNPAEDALVLARPIAPGPAAASRPTRVAAPRPTADKLGAGAPPRRAHLPLRRTGHHRVEEHNEPEPEQSHPDRQPR
jgi:ribosomal-protein-alanine acetyltransferase